MKQKLSWLLCFILLSCGLFVQCAKRTQLLPVYTGNYGNLTVQEVKNILDTKNKIVLLDVRTKEEYASVHIKGSILIPVQELESRIKELNPNKEIIIHCKVGGRSASAAEILAKNNYKHVYNMLSGIDAWIATGYPTEK
jgi:adenylyltransferase/sulfurtransferase